MSRAFRVPVGLHRPVGTLAPALPGSPWPLAAPVTAGKVSRRDLRAVRKALGSVTLAPGNPIRLLLIEDLSGSMETIAGLREAVLRGLLGWARRSLGTDDEVAVLSFGGDACVRLPPTSARDEVALNDPELASYATLLGPTWQLVAGFPRTETSTLAVLISDGLVCDLAGAGGRVNATAAGVNGIALLVPSTGSFTGGIPTSWTAAFPDGLASVVDTSAATHLATEVVGAIAALTGRAARGIGMSGEGTTTQPHFKEES